MIYGQIVYDKAPIVMNMLLKLLGEEAFQKGIREYLQTYLYGNATWDNLITILNKYTDKDLVAWSNAGNFRFVARPDLGRAAKRSLA